MSFGRCSWCPWQPSTAPACTAELAEVERELGRHLAAAHREQLHQGIDTLGAAVHGQRPELVTRPARLELT